MIGERILPMTARTLVLILGTLLVIAADTGCAGAADQSVPPRHRSHAATGGERAAIPTTDATDITGTVNSSAASQAGRAAPTAVAAHARAARSSFDDARAAMERGLVLRDAAPKANIETIDSAVDELSRHLAAIEQTAQYPARDSIKQASGLVQDWYATGLKIIRPPAEGIIELPTSINVRRKAEAVAAALDRVEAEATAYVPPSRSIGPSRKRVHVRSRSAAIASPVYPVTSSSAW